mmetsp:Transcript_21109/g.48892  ORF Transcript_21109/g.48892 Transcript_21109/m.48892 type:complete len:132 (+) Transcript_21109:296-691(+)
MAARDGRAHCMTAENSNKDCNIVTHDSVSQEKKHGGDPAFWWTFTRPLRKCASLGASLRGRQGGQRESASTLEGGCHLLERIWRHDCRPLFFLAFRGYGEQTTTASELVLPREEARQGRRPAAMTVGASRV